MVLSNAHHQDLEDDDEEEEKTEEEEFVVKQSELCLFTTEGLPNGLKCTFAVTEYMSVGGSIYQNVCIEAPGIDEGGNCILNIFNERPHIEAIVPLWLNGKYLTKENGWCSIQRDAVIYFTHKENAIYVKNNWYIRVDVVDKVQFKIVDTHNGNVRLLENVNIIEDESEFRRGMNDTNTNANEFDLDNEPIEAAEKEFQDRIDRKKENDLHNNNFDECLFAKDSSEENQKEKDYNDDQKYKETAYRILGEKFKFNSFKGQQEEAVVAGLKAENIMMVAATGGGKSFSIYLIAQNDWSNDDLYNDATQNKIKRKSAWLSIKTDEITPVVEQLIIITHTSLNV